MQARPAVGVRDTGSPKEPSGHLAHGTELSLRGADAAVVTHHGQAHGPGVDASGVGSDAHPAAGSRQGAGASLEDGAELVDEEVVTDVAPVQGDRVVVIDAPHDGGRLLGGVVVGSGSVVDDDVTGGRVLGVPGHVGGVGPPLGPGGDRHREAVGGRRCRQSGGHGGRQSGGAHGRQRCRREGRGPDQRRRSCGSRLSDRFGGALRRTGPAGCSLRDGGVLDDRSRPGLSGLEVGRTEGLLPLGLGGDEGQLQIRGQ